MENSEIFYPNNLTQEEIQKLDGWKLKVATLHFGVKRGDCVRFGYGYALKKACMFSEEETIHLVADNQEIYKNPIGLGTEIDWNDITVILSEINFDWKAECKKYIENQLF